MHILIGEESAPLQVDRFVHLPVLEDVLMFLFRLIKLKVNIIFLLLSQGELLVDVGLQGVVSHLDLVLALLILLVVLPHILVHVLREQPPLFLMDLIQLRLEGLDGLL